MIIWIKIKNIILYSCSNLYHQLPIFLSCSTLQAPDYSPIPLNPQLSPRILTPLSASRLLIHLKFSLEFALHWPINLHQLNHSSIVWVFPLLQELAFNILETSWGILILPAYLTRKLHRIKYFQLLLSH